MNTRVLTATFPNLVSPEGRSVCPVEIDVDSLSSEGETYRYGGWEDLIQKITAQWVKQKLVLRNRNNLGLGNPKY